MKIRLGLVANSSSSSYCVAGLEVKDDIADALIKLCRDIDPKRQTMNYTAERSPNDDHGWYPGPESRRLSIVGINAEGMTVKELQDHIHAFMEVVRASELFPDGKIEDPVIWSWEVTDN